MLQRRASGLRLIERGESPVLRSAPAAGPAGVPARFPTPFDPTADLDATFWNRALAFAKVYENAQSRVYGGPRGIALVGVGFKLDRVDAEPMLRAATKNRLGKQQVMRGAALRTAESEELFRLSFGQIIRLAHATSASWGVDYLSLTQARQFVLADLFWDTGGVDETTQPRFVDALRRGDYSGASFELMHDGYGGPSERLRDVLRMRRAATNAALLLFGSWEPYPALDPGDREPLPQIGSEEDLPPRVSPALLSVAASRGLTAATFAAFALAAAIAYAFSRPGAGPQQLTSLEAGDARSQLPSPAVPLPASDGAS